MGFSKLTYDAFLTNSDLYGGSSPLWANELYYRGFNPISAIDFYDEIFGDYLEEQCVPEDYVTGEYAGIAIERVLKFNKDGEPILDKHGNQSYKGLRTFVTKGNLQLYDLIDKSDNFCMIAPVSYAGRKRSNENARYLHALCIEVDNIDGEVGLSELIYSWERANQPIPKPTYIVCSGSGLHLYYVFDRPVPLWKNVFENFKIVKTDLTRRIWTSYVTKSYENVQYESVNQPFRVVGTKSKGSAYAMAFEIGSKVTIEYMNGFLSKDKKLTNIYISKCTLKKAKELYPDWYNRIIVNGDNRKTWTRHQPIYYNWKEKILSGANVGKRYNCLLNLCSLAVQCNIAPEQVESDCREVAEYFETLTDDEKNHFTEYDIICALKFYQKGGEKAYRRKIDFISNSTGIKLEANKRNGRKQAEHLQYDFWENEKGRPSVNVCKHNRELTLQFMRVNGEIHGRPSAEQAVFEWQKSHPDGRKIDCNRDTNLDPKTIRKWWLPKEKLEEKISREYFQREASQYIFTESEMTPEFIDALSRNGIRSVNVVPDDEYENALAQGFGAWLQTQKN